MANFEQAGGATPVGGYGRVGYNVGPAGRWFRFGFGLLISAGAAASLVSTAPHTSTAAFFVQAGLALAAIAVAYLVAYAVLGEPVFARSQPWVNTLLLVGPAPVIGYWNLTFGPPLGALLPGSVELAMLAYIGISLVLESFIGYGGCEVVALPIIVFRRRYVTYCVPVVMVDAAERRWTESRGRRRLLWSLLGAASMVTIVLGILGTGAGVLAFLVVAAAVAALVWMDRVRPLEPSSDAGPRGHARQHGRATSEPR